ncbi:MAG: HEAT repeat domain-containing protein [Myxococcota bacterium]
MKPFDSVTPTLFAVALITSLGWGIAPAELGLIQTARAQDGDDAPRIRATLADLDALQAQLGSPNDDEVRGAIERLVVIDHPRVVPPLAELLRSGRSDTLIDRALDALETLAMAEAIDVLAEFTSHRRVGARRRAYEALAAIEDGRVPELVARGLRDSDRSVRGAAALALGEIGHRPSIDVLFQAFERNVVEAAIAIGKLGDTTAIERFNAFLGREPIGVMLSGYGEFLGRNDISVEAKTAVVERLGEIAGVSVRRFLTTYLETFPRRIRNRDLRAFKALVEETIRRIPETASGQTLRQGAGQ